VGQFGPRYDPTAMKALLAAAMFVAMCAVVSAASARGEAAPPSLWAVNVDPKQWHRYHGPSVRRISWRGPIVQTIRAGTYRLHLFDVQDNANFRLRGPGVEVRTTFEYTGTRTFTIKLRRGTYFYSRLLREDGLIIPPPDGFQIRVFRVTP
jgi:hypothetical protein